MMDSTTRIGIVAIVLGAVVGLGVTGVLLTRTAGTESSVTIAAAPEVQRTVDIAAVYNPVKEGDTLPEGFRQLLARDQIEPVYDPQYTSPEQVDWPDGMLILGVEGARTQKAYPITHLNQREMVIDELDGEPILVSW
jgi:hypothetical protein